MGIVQILDYTTKEPITMIGKMAGICYNANTEDKEKNYKRGLDCIISDHGRTLEFPKVYLLIDEYSAKALRDLYTHIIDATRLQASTRYIEYGDFNYITPPTIDKNPTTKEIFDNTINTLRIAIKKLEEMVKEEWEQPIEPAFEVKYKDLVFTAYKNSFYDDRPMLSCYISRNGRMLEHSGRTQYFTEEKALEELKWKYAAYLEMEVIKILKEKYLNKDYIIVVFYFTINIHGKNIIIKRTPISGFFIKTRGY